MDTDYVLTIREANRENSGANLPKTEVPLFAGTVGYVFRDDALRVSEGELRQREGHPVFLLVLVGFVLVPVEPGLRQWPRLA